VAFQGRERRGGRLAAVKAIRPELAGDPAFASPAPAAPVLGS
jgi:hypothetical protein